MKPIELIHKLNPLIDRVRIGVWLIPVHLIGQECQEAARLSIDAVDLRQEYLNLLPHDTAYSGLSEEKVLTAIDKTLADNHSTRTILMYNLDLLVSRLTHEQREIVWLHLFKIMDYRPRAGLISFPISATNLLPSPKDLDAWRREERLADEY